MGQQINIGLLGCLLKGAEDSNENYVFKNVDEFVEIGDNKAKLRSIKPNQLKKLNNLSENYKLDNFLESYEEVDSGIRFSFDSTVGNFFNILQSSSDKRHAQMKSEISSLIKNSSYIIRTNRNSLMEIIKFNLMKKLESNSNLKFLAEIDHLSELAETKVLSIKLIKDQVTAVPVEDTIKYGKLFESCLINYGKGAASDKFKLYNILYMKVEGILFLYSAEVDAIAPGRICKTVEIKLVFKPDLGKRKLEDVLIREFQQGTLGQVDKLLFGYEENVEINGVKNKRWRGNVEKACPKLLKVSQEDSLRKFAKLLKPKEGEQQNSKNLFNLKEPTTFTLRKDSSAQMMINIP